MKKMRTMTIKEKKYFPIKSATSCRLKWSWSTLYLNSGISGSCHRASISTLTPENFFNFHNTERKIADREAMLRGEWPGYGCEYCQDAELAGAQSDRQFQLTIPSEHPTELDSDANLTSVNPTVLEIFFKNTCNLSCVYCLGTFSSRIAAEDIKFGSPLSQIAHDDQLEKDHYEELIPLFWSWLDQGGYDKLLHIHILGGEPFLQDGLYQLIDYIDRHPNPSLTLTMVSNLIIKTEIIIKFMDKIKQLIATKKLKNIKILASVECWGPEQEYIRYGFDCRQFEENIKFLLSQKYIEINLLSTVNVLSINSMPLLAEKLIEWNAIRDIIWYTHLVLPVDKHILSTNYFDFKFYDSALTQVIDMISDLESHKHTETIKLLNGLAQKLKSSNQIDLAKQQELMCYLNEVDRRRNLNWKKTFPWLEEEFKKCGIVA